MRIDDETIERLRAVDPWRVAQAAGLEECGSGGSNTHECPVCTSSDACEVHPADEYRGGDGSPAAKCFSCGEGWSNSLELAAACFGLHCRGEDFVEVCRRVGEIEGIDLQDGGGAPDRRAEERASIRSVDLESAAYALLEDLWRLCGALTGGARSYLADRIPFEEREHPPDVRSVQRDALAEFVNSRDDRVLRAAGLATYVTRPDWNGEPSDGRDAFTDDVLVFAYRLPNGGLSTLRVREPVDGKSVQGLKTADIPDPQPVDRRPPHSPDRPFAAPTIEYARATQSPLYIVEGEIDALSIHAADRAAVGAPGVSHWRPKWCEPFRDLRHVFAVGDGDESGSTLTENVRAGAVRMLGEAWARERFGRAVWPDGADANDLLRANRLGAYLEALEAEMGVPGRG